jgi:NAD-dependent deacetylase
MEAADEKKLRQVSQWIASHRRVVIFTGAGVSTESGISDFRSPGGIWERFDPNEFLFDRFLASERVREKYWKFHTEIYYSMINAQPNPAHRACVELDRRGRLDCVITQNIDNLHQRAGLSDDKVIELHGNALRVTCLSCGKEYDRKTIQERVEQGDAAPACEDCEGILKPATISFGQAMPFRETQEAENRSRKAEVFLAIGSSLVVYPAAYMPLYAKEAGAKVGVINLSPTSFDSQADLVVHEKAGVAMEKIIEYLDR